MFHRSQHFTRGFNTIASNGQCQLFVPVHTQSSLNLLDSKLYLSAGLCTGWNPHISRIGDCGGNLILIELGTVGVGTLILVESGTAGLGTLGLWIGKNKPPLKRIRAVGVLPVCKTHSSQELQASTAVFAAQRLQRSTALSLTWEAVISKRVAQRVHQYDNVRRVSTMQVGNNVFPRDVTPESTIKLNIKTYEANAGPRAAAYARQLPRLSVT